MKNEQLSFWECEFLNESENWTKSMSLYLSRSLIEFFFRIIELYSVIEFVFSGLLNSFPYEWASNSIRLLFTTISK
ncbi:unnamed protein product [Rotaria magnacalcarata]